MEDVTVIRAEDDNGNIQEHKVSDDFIDLCYARAKRLAIKIVEEKDMSLLDKMIEESSNKVESAMVARITMYLLDRGITKLKILCLLDKLNNL